MNHHIEVVISTSDSKPSSNTYAIFDGESSQGLKVSAFHNLKSTKSSGWNEDYSILINAIRARSHSESHLIIIKDPVVTALTPCQILDVIESVVETNYDILYLSSYMDRCDLYTPVHGLETSPIKIVETVSPNGFSAVCISPQGIGKFMNVFDPDTSPLYTPLSRALNSLIGRTVPEGERFIAFTCYPNAIEFDTVHRQSDIDFLKTHKCREPEIPYIRKETKKEKGLGMGVFLIIFIVIIIAIWFFASTGMGVSPVRHCQESDAIHRC